MNRTYNKDCNDYLNYNYNLNRSKESEMFLNLFNNNNNNYRPHKSNSINYEPNIFYEKKYKYQSNSNNCSRNKFIKLDEGEIQLFQKKNKPMTLHINNFHNKNKIKSRQRHKQKFLNHEYNTSNKIKSHYMLNNTNNSKNILCLNRNNPIRLNYNLEIDKTMNEKDILISKNKKIQHKINKIKKTFEFKGNNDEFIEFLKIIKIKADITNLVENIFNKGKNLDEEGIKKCFYKLENMMNNTKNENENLLYIYQYLAEHLLNSNDIKKNEILDDI